MKKLFIIIVVAITLSSCLKGEDTYTCNYNACAAVAPSSEIEAVQSYITANNITAVKHCSGVFYTIENPGTGVAPTACSNIAVTYTGRLTNGSVFDQSTTPVTFNLGGLITGWKNVLPEIKSGGRITLYIPPSLGYGNRQTGSIPPNSILIFSIDLLGVQ